jgi:hypothetical protein
VTCFWDITKFSKCEHVQYYENGYEYEHKLQHTGDYKRIDNNNIIWKTTLMNYLTSNPSTYMSSFVTSVKENMGWPDTYTNLIAGIHIRWGDKVIGSDSEAPLVSIEVYMNELIKLKREYGVTYVYIGSDDDTAIAEILLKYGTMFQFMFDPNEIRQTGINTLSKYNQTDIFSMDGGYEGLNAVKNMILLSSCDFLIGSSKSNFFQAIYHMKYQHNKHMVDIEPRIQKTRHKQNTQMIKHRRVNNQ